jgi:hypothetical protein
MSIDNTDLLDRMASSLAETWPLDSATELVEMMNRVLAHNSVEISQEETRAAVDRAIDRFDSTAEGAEARRLAV